MPVVAVKYLRSPGKWGVSAGGKLIKDKLFYFANWEALRRNFPVVASISAAGSSLFDTSGHLLPNVCVDTDNADETDLFA